MRTLYQFPISHYCEKTRWHLDHKGLDFQVDNLFPALHRIKSKRLAGIATLPILQDGAQVIGDSTEIALYLEQHYPAQPLLPKDAELRAEVLALEERFDRLGVHVRRWLYGQIQQWDTVMHAMLKVYRPWFGLRNLMKPVLINGVQKLYGVTPERVAKSEAELLAGLDLIEQRIGGDPSRYLVGERLSLADVSAAALFAPLFTPAGTPWEGIAGHNQQTQNFLDQLFARPAGQWVLRRYAVDRPRKI
ncbi:glutathione S-transferase family protein [Aquipseudomonas ullengensis]|uniref:Glutathione S-transferase family protein n=1 Tax=Aquipseudomonas ullengensis TaxID=2759166 RepID=A0A7W4LMB7_9GAMM|nr:glutathione S-transferase family protein [Pseudomonas ullengensis]MBB2495806.1 glutathione S-transferase family protein [Pseudomonas ullengensis]